jgi:glycosyltransferase involved in cell wall biosynthesis
MAMNKLSAIVTCFNEEANISHCLQSLRFADEVLVVDSFSTDRTPEIARSLSTRFLQHEYASPARQKNWAIPQAAHEWVLLLDADERVTPELEAEVGQILASPQFDGYWIRRKNFFWGKEIRHGAWKTDKVLRLFKRDLARYHDKEVHEEIDIRFPVGMCRDRLLHYSYRSLDDYVRKAPRYGAWGANDAHRRGAAGSGWRILGHSSGHFFKSYILKQGFRDGVPGLVIAFMEAYHGFFKYAKLYELQLQLQRQTA